MAKWKVQFGIGASCFEDSFEADDLISTADDWLTFYTTKRTSDGVSNIRKIVAMYKATDVRVIRDDS